MSIGNGAPARPSVIVSNGGISPSDHTGSHLAYGGVWGAVLSALARPLTVRKGVALGLVLWGLMQVAVLPFLGWGPFGRDRTPKIAGATLLVH